MQHNKQMAVFPFLLLLGMAAVAQKRYSVSSLADPSNEEKIIKHISASASTPNVRSRFKKKRLKEHDSISKPAVQSSQRYHPGQKGLQLAKEIVMALQDPGFKYELLFDLKLENKDYSNITLPLIIKYIIKREVDKYRKQTIEATNRQAYSAQVMKLIDIAKDMPLKTTPAQRIEKAHRIYHSMGNKDSHATKAENQVFHACKRLYDVMVTSPKILVRLGKLKTLTPLLLVQKLKSMYVKPIHLAVALLIQFHLRNTVNYAMQSRVLDVLSEADNEGRAIEIMKNIAAKLLPVAELLDIHLAHSCPRFQDTCPKTWLDIINNSTGNN